MLISDTKHGRALEACLAVLPKAPEWPGLLASLRRGGEQAVFGLTGAQTTLVASGLLQATEAPTALYVTASASQAFQAKADLQTWLPDREVLLFPPLDLTPPDVVATSPDVLAQRLAVLRRLVLGQAGQPAPLLVAPVAALLRPLPPAEAFVQACQLVRAGDRLSLDRLARTLTELGYERAALVEGPGQFSVRGGVVDVFVVGEPEPVRLEFFDDELESLRQFDVASQRSTSEVSALWLTPAREAVWTGADPDAAAAAVAADLQAQVTKLRQAGAETSAERLRARVEEHLARLRDGDRSAQLAELYAPYLHGPPATLLAYMPAGALVFAEEPARLREAATGWEEQAGERKASWLQQGSLLPVQAQVEPSWAAVAQELHRQRTVTFAQLMRQTLGSEPAHVATVAAKPAPVLHGRPALLAEELGRLRAGGYEVVLVAGPAERARRIAASLPELTGEATGRVTVTAGSLSAGFVWPDVRLAVLTEHELFGQTKQQRRRTAPRAEGRNTVRIASYRDLKEGDYVVHVSHGIGQYLGIRTETVAGVKRDYLYIKYEGEDRLYVPVDQIDLVQKYVGAEGHRPRLYKLGGNEWSRVKARTKESIQKMAVDLLRLQAERESRPGHAFSPDTPWQVEFEDRFKYEETPDQLQAAAEIKRDMEKPRPMDRLLCGDVGYGKTEVAIRAVFKAVMDSKQVAVLVPTTILAQQHYHTFRERFSGYPVRIGVLNRFRTPAEQKQTLEQLRQGQLDVVIGTHRLLSDDVQFKDLGLLVIDEEQRFGVAHKERIKLLRTHVDVLTLTATPIPRTLHMSLVGLRDMSTIETPPDDRYPVETYVAEDSDALIRDAIERELFRGGQVYYLHNRVISMERAAARLQELVPAARIAIAHGQMREDELEDVMMAFLAGDYDVLCCTTIIESGLDIPNVNTLIVADADHLGLAQLYQLRGRVGRSNRLAYAYFLYRRDKVLSEVAEKRLAAIREFTEFGSGFKIALRDLEIRGAGNVLGREQSGFMVSVGFDLYCQLLEETVRELKGQPAVEPEPLPPVDLSVDAYLPDAYIPDARQKIEAYRQLAQAATAADVADLGLEWQDRYGALPDPARHLLAVTRLRLLARDSRLTGISQVRDKVTIRFVPETAPPAEALHILASQYRNRVQVGRGRTPRLEVRAEGIANDALLELLEELVTRLGQWPGHGMTPPARSATMEGVSMREGVLRQ